MFRVEAFGFRVYGFGCFGLRGSGLPEVDSEERVAYFRDLEDDYRLLRGLFKNNYFTEMCSGSEAGSYLRLIDVCITQL